MSEKKQCPILKYPGAKWKIAAFLVSHIPQHAFYLEPFFGSGAVLFNKAPCKHETINDINNDVVNFFRVCRDNPEALCEALCLTPYAREEFLSVQEKHAGLPIQKTGNAVEDARRFAVRCCMGFGAKQSDRVGFKVNRTSKGPECAKLWNRIPGTVMDASARLRNCIIESTDAVELIKKHNQADCFIYADPPYLLQTRNGRIYRNEMGEQREHEDLLQALLAHKGPVMLSGYESDLYNDTLQGWRREKINTTKTSGIPCTETIWMNYEHQQSFFEMAGSL